MALLLRDREATPEAAPPPPDGAVLATVPDFACETCGAAMERGQDWCLECGTAAPGRLGARPGWRAAFTVVGLTTLLLCCAVVAAYAALTSDAQRTASAPPAGAGDPITAQTPGAPSTDAAPLIQPGVTGPGVAPPATPPAATQNTPLIPTTKPPAGATNTPIPTQNPPAAPANDNAATPNNATGSTGTGSTGRTGSTGSTGAASASSAPVTIDFAKDAARTYDPTKRAGAEFGPAAMAIDAKPDTVWDVTVPADGQPIAAGLVIDLGKPYALHSLRLATPTDGFTVEIYGAKSAKQLPEDVIDKRWIHLANKKFVLDGEPISLSGKGDGAKVQLVLLHFTTPAEPDDPRVAIGDVKLRGTP
ncbi:MAG TPA: hypothetical protein VGV90_04225 [Solirubrobacteraceae bacterium]|nr:hypothetical protein [Solirubrobacteraceae bacterium]